MEPQIIGYAALFVWFFSRMPQIRQMYVTKSVDDINFITLFLDFVGSFLYLTYAILMQDNIILAASIQPIFFNITMLILLKLYTKKNLPNVETNVEPNIDPNFVPNIEPNIVHNVEPNFVPNVEPNFVSDII